MDGLFKNTQLKNYRSTLKTRFKNITQSTQDGPKQIPLWSSTITNI